METRALLAINEERVEVVIDKQKTDNNNCNAALKCNTIFLLQYLANGLMFFLFEIVSYNQFEFIYCLLKWNILKLIELISCLLIKKKIETNKWAEFLSN